MGSGGRNVEYVKPEGVLKECSYCKRENIPVNGNIVYCECGAVYLYKIRSNKFIVMKEPKEE